MQELPARATNPAAPEPAASQQRSSMPHDYQRLIDVYRRRIRRYRTENQVNRFHISLEQVLVPAELRQLGVALGDEPVLSLSRKWIERILQFMPLNKARPIEFERHVKLKGVTLYTADVGTSAHKTLILGFTGDQHRLMVPTAFLLDCFNPAGYDLVALDDYSKSLYLEGIPGLGDSFFAMLDGLRAYLDLPSYRNVVAFGTSGGGLAAVLAAIALKLDKGISIGGVDFDRLEARAASKGLPIEPFRAVIASRPVPYPDLLLVHAADQPRDEAFAASVSKLVPGRVMKVSNCDAHGLLGHHIMRRQLPEFLAILLGQDLETP